MHFVCQFAVRNFLTLVRVKRDRVRFDACQYVPNSGAVMSFESTVVWRPISSGFSDVHSCLECSFMSFVFDVQ